MITECVCSTTTDAKLDIKTNKVYCQNPDCGKEILLTEFMKTSMKSNGDIIRKRDSIQIPEGGMQVECEHCENKFAALLNKKDNECYCPKCSKRLNLSVYAKALLREGGMYSDKFKTEVFNGNEKQKNEEIVKPVTKKKEKNVKQKDIVPVEAKVEDVKTENTVVEVKRGRGRPKKQM